MFHDMSSAAPAYGSTEHLLASNFDPTAKVFIANFLLGFKALARARS
jgi:hypothetical protein